MNLVLFDKKEISSEMKIHLNAEDYRAIHIIKILKASENDNISAGVIGGKTGTAKIENINEGEIELFLETDTEPEQLPPLSLLIGLSRPPTMQKVLKEATALGIKHFILCGTENSEKSYRQSKILQPEALKSTIIEGAQQAVSTMLPDIDVTYDLKAAIKIIFSESSAKHLIALDNCEAEKSLTNYWKTSEKPFKDTVIAVGSERGWTDNERKILKDSGFTLCSMGKRVLRTETASISGCALCLSAMGVI
ncbi:MAG: RsmE family RNA methyltransferase [Spirochaetales bacterium]|nr:RsmE family RNA methyltransferase [Spirochaetales bacterium]